MTVITFSVRFHQPFLVGGGSAGQGLDATARADTVLPASSLKGAMRYSCVQVLGIRSALINDIFGQEGRVGGRVGGGAWAWTDVGPADAFCRWARARNRIDAKAGVVRPEALALTEEVWQRTDEAAFSVEQLSPLSTQEREQHVVVLQAAAWGVTALGSWRNRSMGSVTIRPTEPVADLATRLGSLT